MRTLHRVLAPLPFVFAGAFAGACSEDVADINLGLRVPQGLLDNVTQVTLRVIDAESASCDPSGIANGTSGDEEEFQLEQTGCAPGAKWCKEIKVELGTTKIFEVRAIAAGTLQAAGCVETAVDQDPLDVKITVVPFLPPVCCGDQSLQLGEQCDTGVKAMFDCANNPAPTDGACGFLVPDFVCACDCLALEIFLSEQNTAPNIANTANKDADTCPDPAKRDLALAFAGDSGSVAKHLRAVFTDDAQAPTNGANPSDINMRLLNADLYPPASPNFAKQVRLPGSGSCASMFPNLGPARTQKQPTIARLSNALTGVAYADDFVQANASDISVSVQNQDGCSHDLATATHANATPASVADPFLTPAIAGGPDGTALVIWARSGTAVGGRVWQTGNSDAPASWMFLPAADIAIATSSGVSPPRVAGNGDGWVVVYAGAGQGDLDGIFVKTVDPTGTVGSEKLVNIDTAGVQSEPDVAMLPGGSYMVVWHSGDNVFMQRFAASGAAVAGDQDEPLNVDAPRPSSQPVVADAGAVGTFYAVAWTAADGTIWGRFVDAEEKFLQNSVNGRPSDFLASHPGLLGCAGGGAVCPPMGACGQRSAADVAIGGNGYVVIGWTDDSLSHPGVFVRRFPLPE
jgi:hypothetical protein